MIVIILDQKIQKFNRLLGLIGIVLLHGEKKLSTDNLSKLSNMLIDLAMLLVKLKYVYALCED
jgi:hypothetical protein